MYEPHSKTQKGDLIRELQETQAREKSLEARGINSAIILEIITHSGHIDEVIRRLRAGTSQQDVVNWLRTFEDVRSYIEANSNMTDPVSEIVARLERIYASSGSPESMSDANEGSQWTTVPASPVLLDHLFELYFSW